MDKYPLTIRLDDELLKVIRAQASLTRSSLGSVVVDAARQALMPEYREKQEQILLKAMDRCFNRMLHLQGLNVRTDRRHDRRALSLEELSLLLETATDGPVRFNLSGSERALLYRLAVETGLRAGELRSLQHGPAA